MIVHNVATTSGRFVIVVVRADNVITTASSSSSIADATASSTRPMPVVMSSTTTTTTGRVAAGTAEWIVVVVAIVQAVMVVIAMAGIRIHQLIAVDEVKRLEQRREGVKYDEHEGVQNELQRHTRPDEVDLTLTAMFRYVHKWYKC